MYKIKILLSVPQGDKVTYFNKLLLLKAMMGSKNCVLCCHFNIFWCV